MKSPDYSWYCSDQRRKRSWECPEIFWQADWHFVFIFDTTPTFPLVALVWSMIMSSRLVIGAAQYRTWIFIFFNYLLLAYYSFIRVDNDYRLRYFCRSDIQIVDAYCLYTDHCHVDDANKQKFWMCKTKMLINFYIDISNWAIFLVFKLI